MAIKAADIESLAVYPPIGLARIGNAPGVDDYMLAAEVIGGLPDVRGGYRDAQGRIKRQAVRYRIYARMRDGSEREITADDGASIQWRVHVANLKAGWYAFLQAMDLPEGISQAAPRRNADVSGRGGLDIKPAPRTISGRSAGPATFDDGRFLGKPVYLGELRTDSAGRLIFLGGVGASASASNMPATTFANNDGWHDDTCDGSVRATVTIDGRAIEAAPGYVAVAPPNFAPGLFGVVTMEDVVRDLFVRESMLPATESTSFTKDVWPIFGRMTELGWVNHGLFVSHGMGSPLDAHAPDVVSRLADESAANAAWRARVFALFMTPAKSGPADHRRMPQVFGDAYGEHPQGFKYKLERLSVTETMYAHLERWRAGDFIADWPGEPPRVPAFDALPAEDQVKHLARAALYECLGGPFHPGIELTWTLRCRSMWSSPYRLNLLPEGQIAEQDYGPMLSPDVCLGAGGPVDGVAPGALTRWMGVPWQTDEASCNSEAEYAPSLYLSMPTFWGARVPDQVLSEDAWGRVLSDAPAMQRLKHLFFREDWLRDIRGRGYQDRINRMVARWWRLGMVTSRPVDTGLLRLGLPPFAFVETGRPGDVTGSNEKVKFIASLEALAGHDVEEGRLGPESAPAPPESVYGRGEV
jgi:hypothetical protein